MVAFTNFCGVNAATMADIELPMRYHRTQSWEDISTMVQAGPSTPLAVPRTGGLEVDETQRMPSWTSAWIG